MELAKCARPLLVFGLVSAVFAGHGRAQTTTPATAPQELENPPAESDAQTGEFPDDWYLIDPVTRQRYGGWKDIEGYAAPRFKIEGWVDNGIELEELQGKVVVVHFWSMECGPCISQFPKNIKLADKLGHDDFIWLSIHDYSKSRERLPAIVRQFKPGHPVGVDLFNITSRAWKVPAHPFFYVMDRTGAVRAMGLKRGRVDDVVKKLLDEPYDPQIKAKPRPLNRPNSNNNDQRRMATILPSWLEGTEQQRLRLAAQIDLEHPPTPTSKTWINAEPMTLEQLHGKVVLLDFWATWHMPCRAAAPKTNELYEKYKDQGLEIIGVCHPRGAEKMATTVHEWKIKYPVCVDDGGLTTEAYRVVDWPDYYIIDRAGRLRVIDCKDDKVEEAVKTLLNEPDPQPAAQTGRGGAVLQD